MKTYKVLWFDDDHAQLESIKDDALVNDIRLIGFSNAEEGIKEINTNYNFYDAVIVDGKFYADKTHSGDAVDDTALFKVARALDRLEDKKKIPWFILSGQESFTKQNNRIATEFKDNKVFDKNVDEDFDQLWASLKLAADQQIDTQIRHKYAYVFEVCTNTYIGVQNSIELMKILKGYEAQDYRNATYFNAIRKIIEDIFNCCELLNFFSTTSTSMNSRSLEICRDSRVPVYIQRSIHSVVVASQNGSHRLAIDRDVASGKAPYLLASSTFELLNVLLWYKNFVDNAI